MPKSVSRIYWSYNNGSDKGKSTLLPPKFNSVYQRLFRRDRERKWAKTCCYMLWIHIHRELKPLIYKLGRDKCCHPSNTFVKESADSIRNCAYCTELQRPVLLLGFSEKQLLWRAIQSTIAGQLLQGCLLLVSPPCRTLKPLCQQALHCYDQRRQNDAGEVSGYSKDFVVGDGRGPGGFRNVAINPKP